MPRPSQVLFPGIEGGQEGRVQDNSLLAHPGAERTAVAAVRVLPADAGRAAVLIQRFFTAYLPPVWGWATLAWMRRREYV
ncbi:MAG TPA: hypothetical protein VK280_14890 [Streptosporangiaceae bacterium]|nr:hypothetical protein [Streptosporangiaceae bacterium]